MDIETAHQQIQDDSPLKTCIVNDTNEPIKVFSDIEGALATLTDPRFAIETDITKAQIFWLVGPNRNHYKAKAIELNGHLNEFPCDEVLLVSDLFLPLLHQSYKCFAKTSTDENPILCNESYLAKSQLPAFYGRFMEREAALEDNVWAVFNGQLPCQAPVMPCLTKNLDWAMRLTEAGPSASII